MQATGIRATAVELHSNTTGVPLPVVSEVWDGGKHGARLLRTAGVATEPTEGTAPAVRLRLLLRVLVHGSTS